MVLEQLPVELQTEIYKNLDNTDLKNVRSVSRTLADIATQLLFCSVAVGARYKSLSAFQKIAHSGRLANHVREIIFAGSLFDRVYAHDQTEYDASEIVPCDHSEASSRTKYCRSVNVQKDGMSKSLTVNKLEEIQTAIQRATRDEKEGRSLAGYLGCTRFSD